MRQLHAQINQFALRHGVCVVLLPLDTCTIGKSDVSRLTDGVGDAGTVGGRHSWACEVLP